MIIDTHQRDIARIALAAAGRKYGVAFAGGGALQLHDVSARRTQDVDLFVRKPRNVVRAASVIADALEREGYRVEHSTGDDEWPDMDTELREFEVYPPGGGDPVQVQVAHFAYTATVATDVGPAVTLEYLAARKTVALLGRHRVRDYVDIASLTEAGYELRQLVGMAFAEDPSLSAEDVGDAGVHLDRAVTDERLARELPPGKTADWVRGVFADWPRWPVHAEEALLRFQHQAHLATLRVSLSHAVITLASCCHSLWNSPVNSSGFNFLPRFLFDAIIVAIDISFHRGTVPVVRSEGRSSGNFYGDIFSTRVLGLRLVSAGPHDVVWT